MNSWASRATPRPTISRRPIASWRCSIIPTAIQGDRGAEQKFKAINEAYDVLKDEQKRAAYDRFGHAAFENGGGRPGGRRFRLRRRFRRHLRRDVRRLHGPAPRCRRRRQQPRQRSALQSRDHARGRFQGQANDHPRHHAGAVRDLQRQRRDAGLAADRLPDLPRQRPRPGAAGLLHHRADLPVVPRRRPRHRESMPELRRPGPHAQGEVARRVDPGRASRTEPASGWPAKARPACAAARRAISISSSR